LRAAKQDHSTGETAHKAVFQSAHARYETGMTTAKMPGSPQAAPVGFQSVVPKKLAKQFRGTAQLV
jgi:hypothetical protein